MPCNCFQFTVSTASPAYTFAGGVHHFANLRCWQDASLPQAHLTAKSFHEDPVWNVADLGHEGEVQDRIPQHTRLEAVGMLSKEVAGQEATMRPTNHSHLAGIHIACQQYCSEVIMRV